MIVDDSDDNLSAGLACTQEYNNDDGGHTDAKFTKDMGGFVLTIQEANAAPAQVEREGYDNEQVIRLLIK